MATKRRLTAEEFALLPDDGHRYELVDGEVRAMPPPSFGHGGTSLELGAHLRPFVKERGLGEAVSETDFRVQVDVERILRPDLAFVRAERLPENRYAAYFEGAPALAVEVVSPSDTIGGVHEKALQWLAAGSRLVWVVNAMTRAVTAYAPGAEPVPLGIDDTLDGGDVLPGFSLRVCELLG